MGTSIHRDRTAPPLRLIVSVVSKQIPEFVFWMLLSFGFIIGLNVAFEYAVNKYVRPSEYWVEYFSAEPILEHFDDVDYIWFRSNSITRKAPLKAAYADNLQCEPLAGGERRLYQGFHTAAITKTPKFVGFDHMPDEFWELENAIDLPGYWVWSGAKPRYPSRCRLLAGIEINPSPGVYKHITLESKWFTVGKQ